MKNVVKISMSFMWALCFLMMFSRCFYDFWNDGYDFLLHLQLFFGISFSNAFVSAKKKVKIKQGKFIQKNIKNITKHMQKYQENTKNRKLWGASYNFSFSLIFNEQATSFWKIKKSEILCKCCFSSWFYVFWNAFEKNKFYISFKYYNLHRNKNPKNAKKYTNCQ